MWGWVVIGNVGMGFLQKTLTVGFYEQRLLGVFAKTHTVGFYEQRLLGVFIRETLSAFQNAERVSEIGVSSFSSDCFEVGFQPLKAGSLEGINLRVLGWVVIGNVGMGCFRKCGDGVFAKNPYSWVLGWVIIRNVGIGLYSFRLFG
jgi:hypothetical protein